MRRKSTYYMALLCCLAACTTDIDLNNLSTEVGYNTALVIPVGTAHATIDQVLNLVNDDTVLKDSVLNTCYIWWQDSIIIDTDNIHIADFTTGKSITSNFDVASHFSHQGVSLPGNVPNGTYSFTEFYRYDFDYDDYDSNGSQNQRVDSALITSARLYLKVNVTDVPISSYPVTMKVEFPSIPDLAALTYTINQDGQEINETLGAFKAHFQSDSTLTDMKITYTFHSNGSLHLTTHSKITTITQFQIIQCSKAWGFFNKSGVITSDDLTQNIPTDFFESAVFKNNKLLFTNPLIDFRIMNNVGIPMDFEVTSIKAIDVNGNERAADFNGQPNCVIRLEKPTIEGDFSENWAHFNKNYGHTDRLFEITPAKFEYKFSVSVSNFKNDWERKHYIEFPPRINMYINAKLPFQFNPTSYYAYNDTLECDIIELTGRPGKPKEITIDNLNINFKSTNNLPVKVVASAILIDSLGHELYRKDNVRIESAQVDATTGLATSPTFSQFALQFVEAEIPAIWSTKNIVLSLRVDADDPTTELVNFQLDDDLTTVVSLFIKGGIQTDIDTMGNIFK